ERAGGAFLRVGRQRLAGKGGPAGYPGRDLGRGPDALHREEAAHGEHGALRDRVPRIRARRGDDPRRPRRRRRARGCFKSPGGDGAAARPGVRFRPGGAGGVPAQGPRPLREPPARGRDDAGGARPHPQARPRRAVRLARPAPPGDGPHADAPGRYHRCGARLRPPAGRGGGGTARDRTQGGQAFGPGPLRRDTGGPSARSTRPARRGRFSRSLPGGL
ncbi:MAG: Mannitol-1-phosphate 5-dehydrogenase, partial [uncultured Rubrobacteraceae bacterium]